MERERIIWPGTISLKGKRNMSRPSEKKIEDNKYFHPTNISQGNIERMHIFFKKKSLEIIQYDKSKKSAVQFYTVSTLHCK